MTNDQKHELKRMVIANPYLSNKIIADRVGCSTSTVRDYKKTFCKPDIQPQEDNNE